MVNTRRVDPILRQEFPFREGRVNRRELIRLRTNRHRPSVIRQLFVDRDEIPDEIILESSSINLSFAPLSPEPDQEIIPQDIEPEVEQEEEEVGIESEGDVESISGYSDNLSECSTILLADWEDLESDPQLSAVLLDAWEVNAAIRPSVDAHTQTSPPITPPGSPLSYSDHSYSPSYSPVQLEDVEQLETQEIESFYSDPEDDDSVIDNQVNDILDFLANEDFSDMTL